MSPLSEEKGTIKIMSLFPIKLTEEHSLLLEIAGLPKENVRIIVSEEINNAFETCQEYGYFLFDENKNTEELEKILLEGGSDIIKFICTSDEKLSVDIYEIRKYKTEDGKSFPYFSSKTYSLI